MQRRALAIVGRFLVFAGGDAFLDLRDVAARGGRMQAGIAAQFSFGRRDLRGGGKGDESEQ